MNEAITYRKAIISDAKKLSILFKHVYIQTCGIDGVSDEFANFITLQFSVERLEKLISTQADNFIVAGLTLNAPLLISNELNFLRGVIFSSPSNLVVIANEAIVSTVSDSSFVAGPVCKIGNQAFTFPVGKQGNYEPFSITAPGNASDEFIVEFIPSDPNLLYPSALKDLSIASISISEYWQVSRSSGSSNVFVNLSWDTSVCAVSTTADLKISGWNGNSWKDYGSAALTGTIQYGNLNSANQINSFSTFALAAGNSSNPLPITLVHFAGTVVDKKVELKWTTASEINNSFFSVERSSDAINWIAQSQVQGAGNSSSLCHYSTSDLNPLAGTSFYRLKQVDFDGRFTYSFLVVIKLNLDAFAFILYPNPTTIHAPFSLKINSAGYEDWTITIKDLLGNTLYTGFYANKTNGDEIALKPLEKSGTYLICANSAKNVFTKKILVE